MSVLKFFRVIAVCIIALSVLFFSTVSAADAPDEVKWYKVNIPAEGKAGNWLLASGSDIRHLTKASDGTLYCYANPTSTTYRLFKSGDGGYTWSYTGKVEDDIVDIAIVPNKPDIIYYTTVSKIFKSTDAGTNFSVVAINPGGAGASNIEITSLDVVLIESKGYVVIGTRDTDNLQFGGVYTLSESEGLAWTNCVVGNYDVYTVAFSPTYATDRQIIAIVTDETDTFITTNYNNTGWGTTVGNARIAGVKPVSTALALPADYNAEIVNNKYLQFAAVNSGSGSGDVYRIDGKAAPAASKVTDLNIGQSFGSANIDVTGLSVAGNAENATILAGAAGSTQIYLSTDAGKNWTTAAKPPTGTAKTYVLLAPDFNQSGIAYAATGGAESAFSMSRDKGKTWNQIGLIDTKVTTIVDLAVSPDYLQDKTMYLLTSDLKVSLWRTFNDGKQWERSYSTALTGVDVITNISISAQYAANQGVFLAGTSGGSPAIWRSADSGQTFVKVTSRDPKTGAALNIDAWTVTPDNAFFVGSYNGTNGLVCRMSPTDAFYKSTGISGSVPLYSITLSPDYTKDKTLLAGNTTGWIYLSNDDGLTFQPLPPTATAAPLSGNVSVAFDPDFNRNKTVYAASDTANKGIYRFIVDKSSVWEKIDGTLPAGSKISQLRTSSSGALYACNLQVVDAANKKGGIERCLDPNYALGPSFETVTTGLSDGMTLAGLWITGNRIWSADAIGSQLMTYWDNLSQPVIPASPVNKASGLPLGNVNLKWEPIRGANTYKWQLNYDDDFSSIPSGFEGTSQASSVKTPVLEQNTTYYWRVRVIDPALSPWSAKRSFTTTLNSRVIAPKLNLPEVSDKKVSLRPLFQWSAIDDAEKYEFLLSDEVGFTKPAISRVGMEALPSTAWQCDIDLKPDTTYYWKVRGANSSSSGAWSSTGAFTTESITDKPVAKTAPLSLLAPSTPAPSSVPPPTSTPTPSATLTPTTPLPSLPASQPGTPDWAIHLMYIGGGILLMMTLILFVLVLLVLKSFRSY